MDELTTIVTAICLALSKGKSIHVRCLDGCVVRIIECRVLEFECSAKFVYVEKGGYWLVFKEK